jgi:hypothetical protein
MLGQFDRYGMENRLIEIALLAFVLLFLAPLMISAFLHALDDRVKVWRTADRSSAGLLPPARANPGAVVRIFRHVLFAGAELSQPIAGLS